ncbi:MAG: hypothetical protein HBSAPP03_03840 [Phycisphaerae bacterium]|nr:MAG: hypothetical protein HBSAPP03_03840 [Phycisphaerae bacterium]
MKVTCMVVCGAALSAGMVVAMVGTGSATPPVEPVPLGRIRDAAAPEVAALAFLHGTWRGVMHGDPVEETWSAPSADSIIGMFRWQSEGKTTLWEMLSIKAEDGAAVLRLRHFGPDFAPWKGECDGVAAMKATTVEKSKVVFTNASDVGGLSACTYDAVGDTLKITVSFKDPQREALKFELKRAR